MSDGGQVTASPGLGLAKGIIAISLGVVELVIMSFTVRDLANRR